MRKNRVVTATEFKAKCLSMIVEVQDGGSITVTKRGTPVAVLAPAPGKRWKSSRDCWKGKARIVGEIVNLDTADLWDVVRKK